MTELVGQVTLFTEETEHTRAENVGEVSLFREYFGTVTLAPPFKEYLPPEGETPVNPETKLKHDRVVLTALDVTEKKFLLTKVSYQPDTVIFLPEGGVPQFPMVDFQVSGMTVSWEGLGFESLAEQDDVIHVYYH